LTDSESDRRGKASRTKSTPASGAKPFFFGKKKKGLEAANLEALFAFSLAANAT
jgi:hypothetical protein